MRSYGSIVLVLASVAIACLAVGVQAGEYVEIYRRINMMQAKINQEYELHLRASSELPKEDDSVGRQVATLISEIARLRHAIMSSSMRASQEYLLKHSEASEAELREVHVDITRAWERAVATAIEATADKWKQVLVLDPESSRIQTYLLAPFDAKRPGNHFKRMVGDNPARIAQADQAVDEMFGCSADCKQLSVWDVKSIASDATISEWVRNLPIRLGEVHAEIPADVVAKAKSLSLADLVSFRAKFFSN